MSLYIRLRMKESPIFTHLKTEGKTSTSPLKESFGNWTNIKRVLISLFGATAGQGVVWYTGQFYALFYLQSILKVEAAHREHRHRDRAGAGHAAVRRRSARSPTGSGASG